VTPKKYYTFMLEPELIEALKRGKDVSGKSEGAVIREALVDWFDKNGVKVKSAKRRAQTRRMA